MKVAWGDRLGLGVRDAGPGVGGHQVLGRIYLVDKGRLGGIPVENGRDRAHPGQLGERVVLCEVRHLQLEDYRCPFGHRDHEGAPQGEVVRVDG